MDGRQAARTALVEKGFCPTGGLAAAELFLASDEARQITGIDLPLVSRRADQGSAQGRTIIGSER